MEKNIDRKSSLNLEEISKLAVDLKVERTKVSMKQYTLLEEILKKHGSVAVAEDDSSTLFDFVDDETGRSTTGTIVSVWAYTVEVTKIRCTGLSDEGEELGATVHIDQAEEILNFVIKNIK